jgi:hypothetical membrane protein
MTAHSTASTPATRATPGGLTGLLLTAGILAGPLYLASVAVQALTRDGCDLGWVQIATFVVTGLLFVASAIGLRRALDPATVRGRRWGPLLVGVLGAGMVAAGLFPADPVDGFPPGTPTGPPSTVSPTGLVHFAVSSVAFVALAAACFVFSRRFAAAGQRGWARLSLAVGAVFLASWLSVFVFAGAPAANVALAVGIALALIWTGLLAAHVRNRSGTV